jgi:hypothetical protein
MRLPTAHAIREGTMTRSACPAMLCLHHGERQRRSWLRMSPATEVCLCGCGGADIHAS